MHKRLRLGPAYIYIYIVKMNKKKKTFTIFFNISLFFTEIVKESMIPPNGTLRDDVLKRPIFQL